MSLQPFAALAATRGTGLLSGGAATVAAPSVRAGSVIVLTPVAPLASPGVLTVSSVTPGTGFTVSSLSPVDASGFTWCIL